MSFNKVILVGNLGKEPELRYTPQGTPVCSFTIATNERRKGASGELQDQTTWFRVTMWNKQAETASKFLTKGKQVYIEGRLRIEEWTDKEGKTRTSLEVHGTEMQFIGARGEDGGGGEQRNYQSGDARSGNSNDRDYSTGGGDRAATNSGGAPSRAGNARADIDEFDGGASDEDIPF